eukprot:SAG11_NODE_11974_length_728_cov_0.996820_1_plen_78_part_10
MDNAFTQVTEMLRTCGVTIDGSHVALTTRHFLAGKRIAPEPAPEPASQVSPRTLRVDLASVYDVATGGADAMGVPVV